MRSARAPLLLALLVGLLGPLGGRAWALNKQGARSDAASNEVPVNLSGSIFGGVFLFNPTYAARPNNTGIALFRFGLHLDLDLYCRYLTLSYDENSFTDGSSASPNIAYPSEHDHIIGLLSTYSLPHHLSLTLAVHFEIDAPGFEANAGFRAAHPNCPPSGLPQPAGCYLPGYTQSYLDLYARLTYQRGPFFLYGALGGFPYNPTYAARPDNAGIALLRYVLHGEAELLPWLVTRLDLNFFTDREEFPLLPTELDVTSEVAARWRDFELRFLGEADLPLGRYPCSSAQPGSLALSCVAPHPASPTPGLRQFYLALLLQWSFDVRKRVKK